MGVGHSYKQMDGRMDGQMDGQMDDPNGLRNRESIRRDRGLGDLAILVKKSTHSTGLFCLLTPLLKEELDQ